MGLTIERATDVVPLFKPDDRRQLRGLAEAIQTATEDALARISEAQNPEGARRLGDAPEVPSLGDDAAVKKAVRAHDTFKAKAVERATKVNITALRKGEWRDLLAANPPRKDVTDDEGNVLESFVQDQMQGFNVLTIAEPLVLASIDRDQFDAPGDLPEFVDDLSDPDFSAIYSAAVRLNTEGGPDPKFSASSWLDRTSAAMSKLDSPSA